MSIIALLYSVYRSSIIVALFNYITSSNQSNLLLAHVVLISLNFFLFLSIISYSSRMKYTFIAVIII